DPARSRYGYALANGHMNLAWVHVLAGKVAAAEASYQEALAIQRPRAEAEGAAAVERQQLGWILKGMTDTYAGTGRADKALVPCLEAVAVCRRLVKEHPTHFPFGVDLGSTCLTLGKLYLELGQPAQAQGWLDESIRLGKALRQAAAANARVRI